MGTNACIKNLELVVSVSENGSGVAVNESTHQLVDTLKIPDVGILNVMPNPAYPNMVLLYTREEGKQMKLFDVRGFVDTVFLGMDRKRARVYIILNTNGHQTELISQLVAD
ncbi:hypothetical protein LXL04_026046 [Taraxacum kok-saghyz]